MELIGGRYLLEFCTFSSLCDLVVLVTCIADYREWVLREVGVIQQNEYWR